MLVTSIVERAGRVTNVHLRQQCHTALATATNGFAAAAARARLPAVSVNKPQLFADACALLMRVPSPVLRLASAVARRARESDPLDFAFICSGACASSLRFKRAFAEEHHNIHDATFPRRLLFPENRL